MMFCAGIETLTKKEGKSPRMDLSEHIQVNPFDLWQTAGKMITQHDPRQDMITILVRVSIPAQNIMTNKQVGEERVYSAHTSTLLFITRGSQD